MSTTTGTTLPHAPHTDGRDLAVALGVARDDVPSLPLPPLERRAVPGLSPLEASGWARETGVGSGREPVRRTAGHDRRSDGSPTRHPDRRA